MLLFQALYVIVKCQLRGVYGILIAKLEGVSTRVLSVLNSIDTDRSAFNYYRSKTTR